MATSLKLIVLGTVTYCSSSTSTDGAISAPTVINGTAPYTYSYSFNGTVVGTTAALTNLAVGQYVLTVTDSLAAVTTRTYTVDSNSDVALSFSGSSYLPLRNTLGCTVLNTTASFTGSVLNTMNTSSLSLTTSRSNAITIASLPVMVNYTVEFWAYSTQNTNTLCQITRHDLSSSAGISLSNNLLSINGDLTNLEPAVLPVNSYNSWNHYAMVGNANYVAVFQNGYMLKRYPASAVTLSSILQINNVCSTNGNYFVGYMQDLIVSNYLKYPGRCFVPQLLNGLQFSSGSVLNCAVNGETSGSITPAIMTSGTAPFTYFWSTVSGTALITTQDNSVKSGLLAGCYKCLVTSSTGATQTIGYSVLQPISVSTAFAAKASTGNGSALIRASGGYDLFQSTWTNANTSALMPKIPLSVPLLFNGYATLVQPVATFTGCTMESWIYPTASTTSGIIVLAASSANIGVLFTNSNIAVQIGGTTTSFNSAVVVSSYVWQHVAVTLSATGVAVLYLNGVFAAQMTVSAPTNVSRSLTWGVDSTLALKFPGYVTSLRYWSSVRTAGSIFESLYRPLIGSETGLVFGFGVASAVNVNGSTLTDVTGNYTITVTGSYVSSDRTGPFGSIFGDLGNQALSAGTYTVAVSSGAYSTTAYPMVPGNRIALATGVWLTDISTLTTSTAPQTGLQSLSAVVSAAGAALRTPAFIVPALDFTSSFTIEMWVKGSATTASLFQVGNFQYNSGGYTAANYLALNTTASATTGIQLIGTASTSTATLAALTAATWTHCAMTYDAVTNLVWFSMNGISKSMLQGVLPLPANSIISLFNAGSPISYDNVRVTQLALYSSATYTVQTSPAAILFTEDFEQRLSVTATVADCTALGSSDGSISSLIITGGTGPYTITGAFTSTTGLSAITAGRYTVTVLDSLLSYATTTFTVGQPVTAVTTVIPSLNGLATGSIAMIITGGPIDEFSWTLAGKVVSKERNVTSLVAGTYVCALRYGSTVSSATAVVSNTTFTAGTATDCSAYNGTNGSITAPAVSSVSAPVTYLWSNGATTAALSSLSAAAYSCTVSDALGLITVLKYVVNQPLSTVVSFVPSTITALGSVSVTALGGTSVFAYNWVCTGFNVSIGTSSTVTGLPPGSFSCTITSGTYTATVSTTVTGSAAPASWITGKTQFLTNDFSHTKKTCMDLTTATHASFGSFPIYTVPPLMFSKSFTVEFFVYNTSGAYGTPMIFLSDISSWIQLTGTTLTTSSGQSVGITATALNTWQHVAISYDAVALKLYACNNGIISSIVAPTTVTLNQPSICFLWANNQTTSSTPYTNGYFDDVRVSQACLYTGTSYTVPDASTWK